VDGRLTRVVPFMVSCIATGVQNQSCAQCYVCLHRSEGGDGECSSTRYDSTIMCESLKGGTEGWMQCVTT
jgi:hypothetical protein